MRQPIQVLKDVERDHRTPTPSRSEFAEILQQAVAPEGFSLEWVFDRCEYVGGRA